MKRTAITLLTLLLLASLASASLLRITDVGSPPRLQFNMLSYPVFPLNRDLENFGIGLPHPYPDEMALICAYYPPCPQAITRDYPQCQSAGTSHVNVYIDGNHLLNNTGTGVGRLRYHTDTLGGAPQLLSGGGLTPDTIRTKWLINSPTYPYQIELNEWNWIDFVDRGGAPYPAVYFKFQVINHDILPHAVGVMLNLDLLLGGNWWCFEGCRTYNDHPPTNIAGYGSLTHPRAFGPAATPPSTMPEFFTSYQIGPYSPDSQMIITSDLSGPGLTPPDFMAFGNQNYLTGYQWYDDWEGSRTSETITDIGQLMAWGPDSLAPGAAVTWVTRIGLGVGFMDTVWSDTAQIKVVSPDVPTMWFENCTVVPPTLQFNAQLLNLDPTVTALGIGARLEFLDYTDCFSFDSPTTVYLRSDSLRGHTSAGIYWLIHFNPGSCVLPPGEDSARVAYRMITVTSSPDFATDTVYDTMTVRWHAMTRPRVTSLDSGGVVRTSCDTACVTWAIETDDPINVDTFQIYIDDTLALLDSAWWNDAPGRFDTLRICLTRPASDTAKVQLIRLKNIYGCMESPWIRHTTNIRWDRKPPAILSVSPPNGSFVGDSLQPIVFSLTDSTGGRNASPSTIDPMSFRIRVDGTIYSWGDPRVVWEAHSGYLLVRPPVPYSCGAIVTYGLYPVSDIPGELGCPVNTSVRSPNYTFTVVPEGSGDISRGWNLIAQTRGPRWGPDPMPSGIASGFWTYGPAGYATAESLDLGQGAWVLASTDSVYLPYWGCTADSVTLALALGWNLVGGIVHTVQIADLVVDPPGAVSSIYYYDNALARYMLETSRIEPGRGYWMLATDSARVTIHR